MAINRFLSIGLGIAFVIVLISGCAEEKNGEAGIVEHLTGVQQVKTYSKAKTQIQDINKTLEKRYQEI